MRLDFIKLPNRLFYTKDGKESYIKEIKDFNIITTMIYLYSSNDYFGNSVCTLEELILFTGAKAVNRNKGKNLDKMKELLKYMIDKGLIIYDGDIAKVKPKDYLKFKTNFFDYEDDEEEHYEYGFVKIPVSIIDKLLAYDGKEDKIKLLFYWSYIHCRRYKKQKDSYREVRESCTWVSFDKINYDLGLSRYTIDTYNNILVELGLLLIHNSGYLVKGKEVKNCNNIYVTIDEDLETAEMYMKESINRYEYKRRQEGYKISKCSPEEKKSKKEYRVPLEEPNDENPQDEGLEFEQELLEEVPVVEPISEELTAIDVVKIGEIVFKYYEEDLVIEYKSNKLIGFGGEESIFEDVKKNVKISLDAIGYARTEEERNKYKLEAELWQEIYSKIDEISEEDMIKIEEEQNKKIGVLT